jgi:TPP-dependent pyruvate/acetoin dehydrogenase alpha subunit
MRRHPAFDPPEYVSWQPDPQLVAEYRARTESDAERRRIIEALDEATLLGLYAGMLRFRLHDIALKRWVRRGVVSKAWLGTGEEAVTVGCVHALDRERDVVAPMIRNAGACHEMHMPLASIFAGYLGTGDGPNGGRDGHFGDLSNGVLQPISHVGEMVPVCTGVALAFRQRGEARVALTWIGDGATKTAAVHEGLNLAGVLRVPAIFVLQNNQVALGTRLDQHQLVGFEGWPAGYGLRGAHAEGSKVLGVEAATRRAAVHEGLNLAGVLRVPAIFVLQKNQVALGTRLDQHQIDGFEGWPAMYGLRGAHADGNNVLDVYAATRLAAEHARNGGGATLLIAETFRMGGHATHDEAEARTTFDASLFAHWGARDPIGQYEEHLAGAGIARSTLEQIELEAAEEMDAAAEAALENRDERAPQPSAAEYAGISAGVRQPGLAGRPV